MRAILVAALALTACAKSGSVVVVAVNGVPAGVAIVQGTATVGGQHRGFSIPVTEKASYAIEIDLPSDLTGTLTAHVDALDAARGLIAAGDGSIAITPGARADLVIDLGASEDLGVDDFAGADLAGDLAGADLSQCTSSTMCPAASPICNGGACAACGTAGYSSACADRAAAMPICAADGGCGACTGDGQCPAGICAADGSCVPASLIAFVDGQHCTGGAQDGTSLANAYCQITQALAAMPPKAYIRVEPSGYQPITVDHTVTIVGPPPPSSTVAAIGSTLSVAFQAVTTATLTIHSFTFTGQVKCTGNSSQTLVLKDSQVVTVPGNVYGLDLGNCNLDVSKTFFSSNTGGGIFLGSGTAHISESNFNTNLKAGADATTGWGIWENVAGTVTIDRSYFYNNGSGAISINAATYTITNNQIMDEGVLGVWLGSAGTFRYNDVLGSPKGIDCNPGVVVESSIVWHNPMAGNNNLGANCVPKNVVVGSTTAAATGLITLDPVFDPNYHLVDNAADNACCIDKGAVTSGTVPDHDYFGGPRPLGAAPDVGMNELK